MKKLTEHMIQSAFIEIVRLHEPYYAALRTGFAVPNGGARSAITGAILKAEGVRAGVPDWWLPAAGIFQGFARQQLVIEFKLPKKKLSAVQLAYRLLLEKHAPNTVYLMHTDAEQAWRSVADYLQIPRARA